MGYGSGCHTLIPSMTYQWDPQVSRVIQEAGPSAVIVDLGAGLFMCSITWTPTATVTDSLAHAFGNGTLPSGSGAVFIGVS